MWKIGRKYRPDISGRSLVQTAPPPQNLYPLLLLHPPPPRTPPPSLPDWAPSSSVCHGCDSSANGFRARGRIQTFGREEKSQDVAWDGPPVVHRRVNTACSPLLRCQEACPGDTHNNTHWWGMDLGCHLYLFAFFFAGRSEEGVRRRFKLGNEILNHLFGGFITRYPLMTDLR